IATVKPSGGAPPSVKVRDANNNPVCGVSVTFTVTSGGGAIDNAGGLVAGPLTVSTDAITGIATLTAWRVGTTAGANTVTAAVTGLAGSPLTFSATGTAGTATVAQSTITLVPASGASLTVGTPVTVNVQL